jgi:predicted acylesterase/phospholipase RssA
MKYLVVGPGAMTYFAFLGALAALRDCDKLQNLEEISGASAGALLAFFYIIANGNIQNILEYSLNIPLKDIMKPNLRLFLKDFGLISHNKVRKVLEDTIQLYFGKEDLTFKELQEFRPDMPILHVAAYCVNLGKTEYFSRFTTPDMSIIDGLCMSIAVPFLFATIERNGHRYIDGGTLEDTPASIFLGKDNVRILRCSWLEQKTYDTKNLKSYILSILSTTMQLRHTYNFPSICIDMTHFEPFNFGVSTETKLKMFSLGYHSTQKQVGIQ